MTVFVSFYQDIITIRARAQQGSMLGDLIVYLNEPHHTFLGHDYQWWLDNGQGQHEVEEPQ